MSLLPFDRARQAIAAAQAAKAQADAKPALDAIAAIVAAAETAKAQEAAASAAREASAKQAALNRWKELELTMEEAMEHAGISGIDAQIGEDGFCRLVGTVASDEDRQTVIAMAEQFAVTGIDAQLEVVPPPAEDAGAAAPEVSAGGDQPVKYKVKAGESWWGIAQRVYGDGLLWKSLKAANNNPRMIHPGTEIVLPPKSALSR